MYTTRYTWVTGTLQGTPELQVHYEVHLSYRYTTRYTWVTGTLRGTSELQVHHKVHLSYRYITRYIWVTGTPQGTSVLWTAQCLFRKKIKSPTNYNAVLNYIPLMQDFLYNVYCRITPRFTSRWMRAIKKGHSDSQNTERNSCLYLKRTSTRDTARKHAPISCGKYTDYQVTTESSKLVSQLQALYYPLPSCGKRVKNHDTGQRRSERNSFWYTVGTAYLNILLSARGEGGAHCPLHLLPGRTAHWPSSKQDPKRLPRKQSHCRVTLKVWFLKMVSCLGRWQRTKRNVKNWNFGDVTPCCWGSSSRLFGRS